MLDKTTNNDAFIEVPPQIRESYIAAATSIIPFDDLERKDIGLTIEWLKTTDALNKPHNLEEHLGVLAIIVSPDRNSTFLINHKKAGLWLPPGGHVDHGVTLNECVVLECREEIGMTNPVPITKAPVFHTRTLTQGKNAGHVDVTFWYPIEGNPEEAYQLQLKEAEESMWIGIEQLLHTSEFSNLHRGFKKMLEQGLLRV